MVNIVFIVSSSLNHMCERLIGDWSFQVHSKPDYVTFYWLSIIRRSHLWRFKKPVCWLTSSKPHNSFCLDADQSFPFCIYSEGKRLETDFFCLIQRNQEWKRTCLAGPNKTSPNKSTFSCFLRIIVYRMIIYLFPSNPCNCKLLDI